MDDGYPRLPPDSELRRMVHEGMSHAEITAACRVVAGQYVARATVSAALSRALLTQTTGHRFFDCLPWSVRPEHVAEYPARMLRLLGRRRGGVPLDELSEQRLDSWLAMLEVERVVVGYCPMQDDGFVYLSDDLRSGPNPDIPIRRQPVDLFLAMDARSLPAGQ